MTTSSSQSPAAGRAAAKDKLARLDQWIDAYAALYPFSGIVRLAKDDQLLYERCVGLADREWDIPVRPDTRFRLYSLTKPFTALAVMTLVDRGLVSLDAHPGRYVKEAEAADPRVTVRLLLNHGSGLPDFRQSANKFLIENSVPPRYDLMMGCLTELPLNFAPGTGCYYCNLNFFLASRIVEEVAGRDFNEYLQHAVFDELGMADAVVDAAGRLIPRRARGYGVDGLEIVRSEVTSIDWMRGSGNGVATARDVYQLNRAIKGRWLVSESAWREILTPADSGFGLGMTISTWHGRRRYHHNGGHLGFRTLHVQLPEDDFDLIILSNTGFGNARGAFAEAAYQIWYGEEAPDAVPEMDRGFARNGEVRSDFLRPSRPAPVAEGAGKYAGHYASTTATADLALDGAEGVLTMGGQRLPVYYAGEGRFQHKLIDESYVFSESPSGEIAFMGLKKTDGASA